MAVDKGLVGLDSVTVDPVQCSAVGL
jgi:hypothetical protein